MEKLLIDIGQRIYERRKSMGMTQERLAEKMDVSIQMISNLERGNKAIKIENLLKISKILNVSTDYILTGQHIEFDESHLIEKINKLSKRDYQIIEQLVDCCLKS
ncbi:MAG: helix-turn-helix transcriptional regulator [Clostridia bacterium]|nr:helix-turn-helix transcriptional regulator [Clostridia bacterium]